MKSIINRRNFLSFLSGTALAGSLSPGLFSQEINDSTKITNIYKELIPNEKIIKPLRLRKGSKIAITAPASPVSLGEIANCMKVFSKLGYKVEVGDTIKGWKTKYKYFSAPDEARAEEFMNYIERKDIDAIVCARGGYGVMHILPSLNFEIINKNPKIVVGFSDITALINSVYSRSKVVAFHGPLASSKFDQTTLNNFMSLVSNDKKTYKLQDKFQKMEIINKGVATGRLIGGNLSMITSTLGTPYEIETKDSVLFLEDISEHPYKIDRMITQLWLAGKLQECKAIIFGCFKGLDTKKNFWPGTSFTIRNVIEARMKELGIISVIGFPIGHEVNSFTLPIGILAELNTSNKTLKILEECVV